MRCGAGSLNESSVMFDIISKGANMGIPRKFFTTILQHFYNNFSVLQSVSGAKTGSDFGKQKMRLTLDFIG